jgi:DNA-binding response OmpR family regulator
MRVLIVEANENLSAIWQNHVERQGATVWTATTSEMAIEVLRDNDIDIVVMNLTMAVDASFSVTDFASYRRPTAQFIFVTGRSFFSDGSIFTHVSNARAMVPAETSPADLAAMVDHYGQGVIRDREVEESLAVD